MDYLIDDWKTGEPDERPVKEELRRSGDEDPRGSFYVDGAAMLLMTAADVAGQINSARIIRDHGNFELSSLKPDAIQATKEWAGSFIGRTLP